MSSECRGEGHDQFLLSMLSQVPFQVFHPIQRASEVGVVALILGEKADTDPLAQVHTARRRRLGFSPVGFYSLSDRDLRFGVRQL